MRSHQLEEGEDDEETQEKNMGELMKKQAEEKLNLMTSVSADLEDDLEAVSGAVSSWGPGGASGLDTSGL